jgi:hypothetical protein
MKATAMFNYIAGLLLLIAVACGGFAYYEHGQIQKLTQDVFTYKAASVANLKAKEDADASCLVTVTSLNAYYKEQSSLQRSQDATGEAILSLPTLTIKEKDNAAPTSTQERPTYSDDAHLSPDAMRLLDAAYCYGDKDGCATPAK